MRKSLLVKVSASLPLTLVVLLLTVFFSPAYHARAASQTLICQGTENQKFTPAVTNTSQEIHITIDDLLGPCPTTPDPQLTGGKFHLEITRNASCTSLTISPPHLETYKWNNGQQSEVDFTSNLVAKAANDTTVVTLEGTVKSGLDAGSKATKTVTDPDFSTACDTTGLSTLSGTVTLEFINV